MTPHDTIIVAAGSAAQEDAGYFQGEIRNVLRVLPARDPAVDVWLRMEVAAAYDAIKKDPSRTVPASNVRARLAEAHRKVIVKA